MSTDAAKATVTSAVFQKVTHKKQAMPKAHLNIEDLRLRIHKIVTMARKHCEYTITYGYGRSNNLQQGGFEIKHKLLNEVFVDGTVF